MSEQNLEKESIDTNSEEFQDCLQEVITGIQDNFDEYPWNTKFYNHIIKTLEDRYTK